MSDSVANGATGIGVGGAPVVALCASCDRCRARKTKCDGARPCGNCAAKYLKKNKLTSIEGIDPSEFECVYSPAKRRGPVPGKSAQQKEARKADAMEPSVASLSQNSNGNGGVPNDLMNQFGNPLVGSLESGGNPDFLLQTQLAAALQGGMKDVSQIGGLNVPSDVGLSGSMGGFMGGVTNEEMLAALQQQQQQRQMMASLGMMGGGTSLGQGSASAQQQLQYLQQLQAAMNGVGATSIGHDMSKGGNGTFLQDSKMDTSEDTAAQPKKAQRMKTGDGKSKSETARSVKTHLPLLDQSNVEGNRLRSYYDLSVNELFNLPPIPSNEEYCARLPVPLHDAKLLPRFDVAALQAARFSELALGAHVNNQIALALELSNATVMCLRECVEEPVHPSCMFDVARAYFLHGLFRSFRGDMVRYFKYRRVCMTHLSQMDNVPRVKALLSSIAFHDSWAYVVHNAEEKSLPNIDGSIPPIPDMTKQGAKGVDGGDKGLKATDTGAIVSNPMNQMWIQGPPPIFIDNEAPPLPRSLDALACAVRSCCDQANRQFEGMAREMNNESGDSPEPPADSCLTPTQSAVMSNENELCSRNMVLSAFTLLQQHEATTSSINRNRGHHMIISAMDAFLENSDDEEGGGGFTDSQIQSLLSVCNTVIEFPLLLHQGGPIYHMCSNSAILLCHLLNGMYASRASAEAGELEASLFDEVLDTLISVRKVLNTHRRKLPVRLRCHGIPRPNFRMGPAQSGDEAPAPFIDLGETLMCFCRGCQGFVLMACSPCVAAEKAQSARYKQEMAIRDEENGTNESGEVNEFDKELYELGSEFDMDDDALLNVLSRIIAS